MRYRAHEYNARPRLGFTACRDFVAMVSLISPADHLEVRPIDILPAMSQPQTILSQSRRRLPHPEMQPLQDICTDNHGNDSYRRR